MFDFSAIEFGFPFFVRGVVATVMFCVIATVVGLLLGTVVALGRVSKRRLLRGLSMAFIEPFRNTPFLVQAFLVYFGLAQIGLSLSATLAGIVILSLFSAAMFAEGIRGGILSVPKGQLEAARAAGIPYLTAMRRIVFPQTISYMIPVITNLTIGLIKESAALSVISVHELTMAGQIVVGETFRPIEAYLPIAILYWLLTAAVVRAFLAFQRYLGHRQSAAVRATGMALATPQLK
jgi:His/Glu/Gln/Arg/opine family amino acid ABC transporter permease subunit